MSICPYLIRRGNTLYFRIVVPVRFRQILKTSEFKTSLRTQDRRKATPAAYRLAGGVKSLFFTLDEVLSKMSCDGEYSEEDIAAVLNEIEQEEAALIASLSPIARKIIADRDREKASILAKANQREKQAELKTKAEAFDKLLSVGFSVPAPGQPVVAEVNRRSKAPRLSVIRESHLGSLNKSTIAANKKTTASKWWDAFIELVGDKQASDLEQIDIDCYLEEICFLPSQDGAPEYRQLSYKEKIRLCKKNKAETISKKSFVNNYKAPIKKFVEYGYLEFKSVGFKKLVVNDSNRYNGNQESSKGEQRPLTIDEVNKLVNNDVMKGYISKPDTMHFYWLPVLALFSGARLNELCQLHPTKDIRQDENTGVWFFEVTEGDDGEVAQFAKSEAAKREVPLHQKLIDLGFIDYVLSRRSENAPILFPFQPRKNGDVFRAGDNAGQEFTKYLKKVGLHDSTAGNKVAGLHSLRKTFITEAASCGMCDFLSESDDLERFKLALGRLSPIVGHETSIRSKAGEDVSMTGFYAKRKIGELKKGDIGKKKVIIDALDYGVVFPKPLDALKK